MLGVVADALRWPAPCASRSRLPAQNPAEASRRRLQQPTFRARVNVVRVDVSVFDRDGEPSKDLQPSDFVVKEDGVAADRRHRAVHQAERAGADRSARSRSIIRSAEHATVEAAREDVRLFVLFLDDYHVDKAPTIMIPLKRTLKAFVEKLGPVRSRRGHGSADAVDARRVHARSQQAATRLVSKFEGRRGELFPVRSAAEEAQQSQRNVWELRAGVTLDALNAISTKLGGLREGRKSILFVSQGPPVSVRSVNWPRMEDVVQSANRGNVTIHTLDPRPLGAVGVRRQLGAAPLLGRDRRTRDLQHQRSRRASR